ncbi:hypothetical protein OCUBac02_42380 [Bosea sp. ANAM02]|nr:hypothetical protein OCUBac02_42380 [Bosea sp. ANAM02]
MPEGRFSRGHDLTDGLEIGKIDPMEACLAAGLPQAVRHRLATLRIAPGQEKTASAASGEFAGDRLAEPLAAAGDDRNPTVKITAERTGLRQGPASRSEWQEFFGAPADWNKHSIFGIDESRHPDSAPIQEWQSCPDRNVDTITDLVAMMTMPHARSRKAMFSTERKLSSSGPDRHKIVPVPNY